MHYIIKFSLSQHINKVTKKTGLLQQRCYRVHKILAGRAKIKDRFSLGNGSTKNMGMEVIFNVQDTLNAQMTPNCHLV